MICNLGNGEMENHLTISISHGEKLEHYLCFTIMLSGRPKSVWKNFRKLHLYCCTYYTTEAICPQPAGGLA